MKLISLFLLLNVLLHASYTKALDFYKKGEYQKVLYEAKHSYSEYDNPKLHLLWANSAKILGYTTEAMGAYERVLILDKNNQVAKNALKDIYIQTDRIGLSTTPLQEAKSGKLSSKINISLGHDNNVNANPGGDALDEYYGVVGNSGTISSNFLRFTGELSYLYKIEDNDAWSFRNTLNFYKQSNFEAHKYDLLIGSIEFAAKYNATDYTLFLPFTFDAVHYLDKNLMQRYRFMPKLYIPILTNSFLNINANYTRRSYNNTIDKNNDANTYGIGIGIYSPIATHLAHLNIKYEKRSSDNNLLNQFIDASFITVNADFKYVFNSSFLLETNYTFRYGDYVDDIGTLTTPSKLTRVDYFNQIDFKFSYLPQTDIELYIRDTFADNSSNYIPTEYKKNVLMFGINLTY